MVGNDATRPVWLGLGRGVSDTMWGGRGTCTGNTAMYADYAKGGDILSFDIYPVNGGIGLEAVPKGVDNLRMWSNYEKPVVADIEGSDINDTTPPDARADQVGGVDGARARRGGHPVLLPPLRRPTFSETDCLDDATTKAALPEHQRSGHGSRARAQHAVRGQRRDDDVVGRDANPSTRC